MRKAMLSAVMFLTAAGPSETAAADPVSTVVAPFFAAVAREDAAAATAFLTPEATVRAMFHPNGETGPDSVRMFPAAEYFALVTRNYDNIVFHDRIYTVADNGRTVWMEAQGNLVVAATGAPYRNAYVFKLTLDGDRIATIQEWVNTVTLTMQGIPARPDKP